MFGQKSGLTVQRIGVLRFGNSDVLAIRLKTAGLYLVCKVKVEDVFQAADKSGAGHRKQDLHAVSEIPTHEISTPEIDLLLTSVSEVVDAAVLQVPPNDA